MLPRGGGETVREPHEYYHFVILNIVKNLDTFTLCFQILHFIQNDNSIRLMKEAIVIIALFH